MPAPKRVTTDQVARSSEGGLKLHLTPPQDAAKNLTGKGQRGGINFSKKTCLAVGQDGGWRLLTLLAQEADACNNTGSQESDPC